MLRGRRGRWSAVVLRLGCSLSSRPARGRASKRLVITPVDHCVVLGLRSPVMIRCGRMSSLAGSSVVTCCAAELPINRQGDNPMPDLSTIRMRRLEGQGKGADALALGVEAVNDAHIPERRWRPELREVHSAPNLAGP